MNQQIPTLNGVLKPADVIARGPHVYDEATHSYREIPPSMSPYPRAMWHETKGYQTANSQAEQEAMEAEGWSTKPFPEKIVAKETVMTTSPDLALIVLQQQQQMREMQAALDKLTTTEEPKRGRSRAEVA